ncbi:MAG TPA: hypothetical protein VGH90_09495, partial [Chthoniobacteraceae bacterium]
MTYSGLPEKQGLYDPQFEHDACGVGFVCQMKGKRSHEIVEQALTILLNLDHRGACGCEANTGDGAGILIQVPHRFLAKVTKALNIALPEPGHYGVGMVFSSKDPAALAASARTFEQKAADLGLKILGWREVPTDNSSLGMTAQASEPSMRQVFIARPESCADDQAFERKLYILRKYAHFAMRNEKIDQMWYCSSLSCRTV